MKDVGLPDTLKLQIEDMMNNENMVNKIRDIDKNRHHFLQKLEIYKNISYQSWYHLIKRF